MTTQRLPTPTVSARSELDELPVVIIGAGPVGLAAAAHLVERGIRITVIEAGPSAGTAVAAWGHTRLFSPWEFLVDEAAGRLLAGSGWQAPPAGGVPYGRDLVADYLLPLAATPELAPRIRYGTTVIAVSRRGMDRTRSLGRSATPFLLRTERDGESTELLARAVIDASGTFGFPNGITASGFEPARHAQVRGRIMRALPDVLDADRARFAGKRVLVVGAGHSAANTVIALAALARDEPSTTITWAIRSASPIRVYGSAADELEGRGRLGSRVHDLVLDGSVVLVDRFEIDDVVPAADDRVSVVGRRASTPLAIEADVVVHATGFRPDIAMLREVRLSLDDVVEAPRALAPLIDPNLHSCGTVPPHGVVELTHPEPDFYIAGMKSYGRAPTFLLATGYEQVRSIADELAGNSADARRVQLVLPETGVCSTRDAEADCGSVSGTASGCCA
jgi:thioredoxin reductase